MSFSLLLFIQNKRRKKFQLLRDPATFFRPLGRNCSFGGGRCAPWKGQRKIRSASSACSSRRRSSPTHEPKLCLPRWNRKEKSPLERNRTMGCIEKKSQGPQHYSGWTAYSSLRSIEPSKVETSKGTWLSKTERDFTEGWSWIIDEDSTAIFQGEEKRTWRNTIRPGRCGARESKAHLWQKEQFARSAWLGRRKRERRSIKYGSPPPAHGSINSTHSVSVNTGAWSMLSSLNQREREGEPNPRPDVICFGDLFQKLHNFVFDQGCEGFKWTCWPWERSCHDPQRSSNSFSCWSWERKK